MRKQSINRELGSIMIIVPHEDDEILLCAGVIEQAVACGLAVKVVMATNGDYGCADYSVGRARLAESRAGLAVLGLSGEHFIPLGYADTGMAREESFLTQLYEEQNAERIWASHCSKQTYGPEGEAEYHQSEFGAHAPYNRKSFYTDLKGVLAKYRPETIFTTSEEDVHGDHSALYLFVREALEELTEEGYRPALYSGIVHSRAGDENWPLRTEEPAAFSCPQGFDETGGLKWEQRIVFDVPEDMRMMPSEQNRKAQALSKHITALKPDAVDFLYSFVKSEELFWRIL